MSKEKILTLTANDFVWDYYRTKGKGGQKKNKTESACRCRHIPSGALACAEESRSQYTNKRIAFEKVTKTKEFEVWLKVQISKISGDYKRIEEEVNNMMSAQCLKIEEI